MLRKGRCGNRFGAQPSLSSTQKPKKRSLKDFPSFGRQPLLILNFFLSSYFYNKNKSAAKIATDFPSLIANCLPKADPPLAEKTLKSDA